ncbi:MAG: site-specific DNA-methyltransferase [Desulfovibrio sp.]|jgi:site-specific DNA-methyltransferase (adenine-specific)|nr:site-specific DNA-methyltransferase [Desulfovibrio sp.]
MPQRAPRNRTLSLSASESAAYAARCAVFDEKAGIKDGFLNNIVHGDIFAVSPCLPDNFVDLLIADPPYNLNKNYAKSRFRKMSEADYAAFTEKWLIGLKPALKKSASLYVCCDWPGSLILGSVLNRHFKVRNRITWQREKGRGAVKNWKNGLEDIWFATVSDDYVFNLESVKIRRRVIAPYRAQGRPKDWTESPAGNFRDTRPSNFWDDLSVPYWSMSENTEHPAQKPEKLMARIILASSKAGDVVFDPFAGSGASLVAARKLGRQYAGVERELLYCALAQKRLELATADPGIQGYADGVFWERNTSVWQRRYSPKTDEH